MQRRLPSEWPDESRTCYWSTHQWKPVIEAKLAFQQVHVIPPPPLTPSYGRTLGSRHVSPLQSSREHYLPFTDVLTTRKTGAYEPPPPLSAHLCAEKEKFNGFLGDICVPPLTWVGIFEPADPTDIASSAILLPLPLCSECYVHVCQKSNKKATSIFPVLYCS